MKILTLRATCYLIGRVLQLVIYKSNDPRKRSMIFIHNFSSQDSLWASLSLGILLFVLFCAVWYSKMWRRKSEFYEKYGTENDTDTSTEMAWSKHGHHTTVPLRGKLHFP